MEPLDLERGYETGAARRGLELLGVTGTFPQSNFLIHPKNKDFLRSTAGHIHLSGGSPSYVPQAELQSIDRKIFALLPS